MFQIIICVVFFSVAGVQADESASFLSFEQMAKHGDSLTVAFFGASLTWGANADDPNATSYRGLVMNQLSQHFPQARFKFVDAAIGGTGSRLGIFRLDRDVLRHKPDLVFLDFSANDGIYDDRAETLASYEAIVRRIIVDGKALVIPVIFPFKNNVTAGKLDGMKRREAHLAIAKAYGTVAGDAIALGQERVRLGATTVAAMWPFDGVHPGNAGYQVFADAAWQAFREAIERRLVCTAPAKMLHPDTYLRTSRVRISTLTPLPSGWQVGRPNPVAAFHDMLMSRWLDDEVVATTGSRLRVGFQGSMVMLLGESTTRSASYRSYLDGKLVHPPGKHDPADQVDAGALAKRLNGNTHHVQVIAEGLDPAVEHTLEIEPVISETGRELRLESICVAGGEAKVRVLAGDKP